MRLRGLYEAEGRSKQAASASKANKARRQNPAFEESQPKPEPVNMRKKIAKELSISENRVHQIQTIGDAAKAGVPEAKEALARANKGEITVNRAIVCYMHKPQYKYYTKYTDMEYYTVIKYNTVQTAKRRRRQWRDMNTGAKRRPW